MIAEGIARVRRDRVALRADQVPPEGDWQDWVIPAGRGWGKTRAICEWMRDQIFLGPDGDRWAIVAPAVRDAREILVPVILDASPAWFMPEYQPSMSRLIWPNGTIGYCLGSHDPSRFRGWTFGGAICDEVSRWEDQGGCIDAIHQGLRSGPGWHRIARAAWTVPALHESVTLIHRIVAGRRCRVAQ